MDASFNIKKKKISIAVEKTISDAQLFPSNILMSQKKSTQTKQKCCLGRVHVV